MATLPPSPRAVKLRIAGKLTASLLIPAIPIAVWWYNALEDRAKHAESVRTKVRISGVQTTDERIIEKIHPGDIILFDRRCDKCAAGALSALHCMASKRLLCRPDTPSASTLATHGSSFDHVGVVVS